MAVKHWFGHPLLTDHVWGYVWKFLLANMDFNMEMSWRRYASGDRGVFGSGNDLALGI